MQPDMKWLKNSSYLQDISYILPDHHWSSNQMNMQVESRQLKDNNFQEDMLYIPPDQLLSKCHCCMAEELQLY
jgi:hypothetical protein